MAASGPAAGVPQYLNRRRSCLTWRAAGEQIVRCTPVWRVPAGAGFIRRAIAANVLPCCRLAMAPPNDPGCAWKGWTAKNRRSGACPVPPGGGRTGARSATEVREDDIWWCIAHPQAGIRPWAQPEGSGKRGLWHDAFPAVPARDLKKLFPLRPAFHRGAFIGAFASPDP